MGPSATIHKGTRHVAAKAAVISAAPAKATRRSRSTRRARAHGAAARRAARRARSITASREWTGGAGIAPSALKALGSLPSIQLRRPAHAREPALAVVIAKERENTTCGA